MKQSFPQVANGKGVFCFDSSGAGIVACCLTAKLDEARRGGAFLLRLAELSTSSRWYWTMDSDGNAVESHGDPRFDGNTARPDVITAVCFMEKENAGQGHWKSGFFVACCTYLYRLFDDERYLDAVPPLLIPLILALGLLRTAFVFLARLWHDVCNQQPTARRAPRALAGVC